MHFKKQSYFLGRINTLNLSSPEITIQQKQYQNERNQHLLRNKFIFG